MKDPEHLIAEVLATAAFKSGKEINVPCPEGRQLGEHLARWADGEIAKRKQEFPNHVERCATCAFRRGTAANGSVNTVMDALKCTIEGRNTFCCHERANHDCVGFAVLNKYKKDGPECPWEFSDEYACPESK